MYEAEYEVEYDSYLGCYVLVIGDDVVCLGAKTHLDALNEAKEIYLEYI